MPRPEDVNPHNFQVSKVIYNDEDFSIAWGVWEKESRRLAMRWNGEGTDAGYPKTFGNPVWFLIPENLNIPIMRGLIGTKFSDITAITNVLNQHN